MEPRRRQTPQRQAVFGIRPTGTGRAPSERMRTFLRHAFFATAIVVAAHPAFAQAPAPLTPDEVRDVNLRAYTELLRADLRTQKVAFITEIMQFTEDEDAKFWPIYRAHETALAALNDERMALIKDYATNFEALTDQAADRVAKGALDLQARRQAELAAYYEKMRAVLPAKTAARALQVEHQLLLILDLQIAASLPIAQ